LQGRSEQFQKVTLCECRNNGKESRCEGGEDEEKVVPFRRKLKKIIEEV
jgi:hypothetical protein